jgi:multiple sugar transport system ATP-binding protein
MASVELNDVGKVYPGNVPAVRAVSLDIQNEEFVVLVGPSGCGKTTTLRMVAGLEDPSSGTIRIGDRVVNNVAPKDRDIAMVFQSYALYPHMTVYKNLAFALKLRRTPKAEIERRVMWAADLLGLRDLLDRRPRALSGGQRQRVAVGRAIVRQPKVFLFDEPLSNLDAKLRVTTRAELKRLQQDLKTTTMYVTHDQEEAMTLGDKVVVMHQGRIQQVGTPLEVYRRPANRFVAGFVGMPPMNLLDGIVSRSEAGLVFEAQDFKFPLPGLVSERLRSSAIRNVALGIRPEAFRIGDPSRENSHVQAQVEVVEMLGPSIDIYARLVNGTRIIARLEAQHVRVGETIELTVAPQMIHLFGEDRPNDQEMGVTHFGENLINGSS